MNPPDQELLRRAKAGDRDAAGQLLLKHIPGVRAFVRLNAGRMIRDKESMSDLVQSVCLEVLADLGDLESDDEATFKKWLYTAATRKIVDRDRHHRAACRDARRLVEGDAVSSTSDAELATPYLAFASPSTDLAIRDEIERIETAFDRLPDDYRRILTLTSIVGLSTKEVAVELERNEPAIRKLLSRARARLAMLLTGAS